MPVPMMPGIIQALAPLLWEFCFDVLGGIVLISLHSYLSLSLGHTSA
jgi:hypothetical protein